MSKNKALCFRGNIMVWMCCCLLAAACERDADIPTPSEKGKEVPLDFSAAVKGVKNVQNIPTTRGVNVHDNEKFPNTGDLSNTTFQKAGMFITTQAGGEIFPNSRRMKVTSQSEGTSVLCYTPTEMSSSNNLRPKGFTGGTVRIAAYWPWNTGATSIDAGVPFDFRTINNANKKQRDLLYYGNNNMVIPADGRISLQFKHAYCRVKIKVKKSENKDVVKLSSIGINNLSGEWIKNKGQIDLMTGYLKEGSTAGGLLEGGLDVTLLSDSFVEYEFLVPAFMSPDVNDEEVMFQIMVNGKLVLFPLDRKYLNSDIRDGKVYYGFEQGYVNTYEVVYNNSAVRLDLLKWNSLSPDGTFGLGAAAGAAGVLINIEYENSTRWGYYPTSGFALTGTYKDYLTTVALGNNGSYLTGLDVFVSNYAGWGEGGKETPMIGDINVYTNEKPVQKIYMSKADVTPIPVPWEEADGRLIAKEACRKFRGGGFDTWRLPRASELRMVVASFTSYRDIYESLNLKEENGVAGPYWTATEMDADKVWGISIRRSGTATPLKRVYLEKYSKKGQTAKVRCVRDKID